MNIQYVRLDDDICEVLNRLAFEQRRTVSEVVNEIARGWLARRDAAETKPAE
jgi:predicted transcriptional regulator